MTSTAKGSLWRIWDFHSHTPASHHWNGKKLRGLVGEEREILLRETVDAMRNAEPDVFVIMDYWTFDGYKAIRKYVSDNPESLGGKQLFPGIELRIESSHKKTRLNVHLIIDPTVNEQCFDDVLADLKIELTSQDRGISEQCFIQFARELGEDKLKSHSFDPLRVKNEEEYALSVGMTTAEIKPASLLAVLDNLLKNKGLLFLPWDTYGGLKEIDFAKHYGEVRRLMRSADIFECKGKDVGCMSAFHGRKCRANEAYFENFWAAIDKTPRLCVRGTDAHSHAEYGKFPNDYKTWLKVEPTFRGLLQAIQEPYSRSYIGLIPPKKEFVETNGRLFMTRLTVHRSDSSISEKWFDGLDLELNSDLIVVIGNKGSGKSGLAEVMALAGNSKSTNYFTFINEKRFLSGNVPRASAFQASLTWQNGDCRTTDLSDKNRNSDSERVKYISQTYFEDLCNEHVSGTSDRFGEEIRKVLFTNMDPAEKLNFATLDEYLQATERAGKERIENLRSKLVDTIRQIVELERQASPPHISDISEKLAGKNLAMRDLELNRPQEIPAPIQSQGKREDTEQLRLAEINKNLEEFSKKNEEIDNQRKRLNLRRNELTQSIDKILQFEKDAKALDSELCSSLEKVGINVENVIELTTKIAHFKQLQLEDKNIGDKLSADLFEMHEQRAQLVEERTTLQNELDAPNKAYQEYLEQKKIWEEKKAKLVGATDAADTIEYYQEILRRIEEIPEQKQKFQLQQNEILREIHTEFSDIASARKALFEPIGELLEQIPSIKEDLKVEFQSNLFFNAREFIDEFFLLIKRSNGGFRGEDEGPAKLHGLIKRTEFASIDEVC